METKKKQKKQTNKQKKQLDCSRRLENLFEYIWKEVIFSFRPH